MLRPHMFPVHACARAQQRALSAAVHALGSNMPNSGLKLMPVHMSTAAPKSMILTYRVSGPGEEAVPPVRPRRQEGGRACGIGWERGQGGWEGRQPQNLKP